MHLHILGGRQMTCQAKLPLLQRGQIFDQIHQFTLFRVRCKLGGINETGCCTRLSSSSFAVSHPGRPFYINVLKCFTFDNTVSHIAIFHRQQPSLVIKEIPALGSKLPCTIPLLVAYCQSLSVPAQHQCTMHLCNEHKSPTQKKHCSIGHIPFTINQF